MSSNCIWTPWMRRAIQLASLAEGFTSPNPLVGAIILDVNGNLVGEGFHSFAGGAHAEVEALLQASEKAQGGTLVVTLEPCCHYGRTPPCTEAILKSGITRVVVGMKDPDPRVSGAGIDFLKTAGLEVIVGVMEEEAVLLNKEFIFRVKTGRPWALLKWAMSLDGRVGLKNGESKWITSKESRMFVHKLRSKCDAVIVGGGTIRRDNPLLTTRGLSSPEPLRVVLTRKFEFSREANIFDTEIAKTLIVSSSEIKENIINELPNGVDLLEIDPCDPINLLKALAEKGCNRVLWECGPKLSTSAIEQNCVQELLVFMAPKLLGGISSMNPLEDLGFVSMNQVFSTGDIFLERHSNDLLLRMIFP